jgi:hypothetical protein
MIHWLTTAPHPHAPATGFDAGQKGWRLHAVEAPENASFESIGRAVAVCGTRPRYGWSIDLFIERRCSKCVQKLGVEDVSEKNAREQAARWRAEYRAKNKA